MAGSFNHVVKRATGELRNPADVCGMLEARGSGDVYEAVEEMYGMIWYPASRLDYNLPGGTTTAERLETVGQLIEEARENYRAGLELSPTRRFQR